MTIDPRMLKPGMELDVVISNSEIIVATARRLALQGASFELTNGATYKATVKHEATGPIVAVSVRDNNDQLVSFAITTVTSDPNRVAEFSPISEEALEAEMLLAKQRMLKQTADRYAEVLETIETMYVKPKPEPRFCLADSVATE